MQNPVRDNIIKEIKEYLYSSATVKNMHSFNYQCPICKFCGVFANYNAESGKRKYAQCPQCKALERHRLQYLVILKIGQERSLQSMDMLHFAPEEFFRKLFPSIFRGYVTADLSRTDVDKKEDLTKLSFGDTSFDLVFASCVFPYIKNDSLALSEIRRILKPNGIAIITVPVIGKKTIEYPEANSHEENHIRCPGLDYHQRYKAFFSEVKLYSSKDFDKKYQLYVYQDRMKFSRKDMPLRPLVRGKKHMEYVAVCCKCK